MSLYAVTRKSDGAEVIRYAAMQVSLVDEYPLTEYDHTEFDPEAPPPPEPVAARITKLAFINRFTDAEWIAFDLTALDNPNGSPAERQQKSGMRLFMKRVELAQFIDLSRADTRTGVQTLEAAGLLAPGRALVILDTPPTEGEAWSG